MTEVTLTQILSAREERVRLQHEMLAAHRCPLVCFTMNIAGPVKTSPTIERAFREGLGTLLQRLPQHTVKDKRIDFDVTGCQALLAVDMDAHELKDICTGIEEENALGRLFDMDVLDADGSKLERSTLRGCIVCGAPGRACAAGRLHPVEQLQSATAKIIESHFAGKDRRLIASIAVQSLLDEVNTTPKPGLVDRHSNGSHKDMNVALFTASACSLQSYFENCIEIGQSCADESPASIFPRLRLIGKEAEQTMYRATGGVNTHKGAIFTMGILCGSVGLLWSAANPIADTDQILALCSSMTASAMKEDFRRADDSTAGQRLYIERGLTGVRGEVAAGFPSVSGISLPIFRELLGQRMTSNDAGAITLLHLIAHVQDTVLFHRGGPEGAAFAADSVRKLLARTPAPSHAEIEALDDAFTARNLSPGGCADLLAATYFLHALSKLQLNP